MQRVKLKRCPFCGGTPVDKIIISQNGCNNYYLTMEISCPECKEQGRVIKETGLKIINSCSFEEIESAINEVTDAWNRRIDDDRT